MRRLLRTILCAGLLFGFLTNATGCLSQGTTEQGRSDQEAKLHEAQRRFDQDPTNEDAIVWLGRRLAYLARYDEAIEVYTNGLKIHPESYRILRHRGHRYISTRRFDLAVADLLRAAELAGGQPNVVEQDGLPNARNLPIGTTHGNIYYHLGLAHYLRGELEEALEAYDVRARELDRNPDNLCSTSYWRYLILRKLGRAAEAQAILEAIREDFDIIENFAYHELLLLYKGVRKPKDFQARADDVHSASIAGATQGYGVSMYYFLNGDEARARSIWNEILGDPAARDAFGTIAAEAELARTGG